MRSLSHRDGEGSAKGKGPIEGEGRSGGASDSRAGEQAGRTRYSGGGMVLVLSLCCFVFGCAFQYILGVPDEVAATAGVELSDVSVMVGVYSIANAIGAPIFVTLMRRCDQKVTLLVALLVMACGMAIVAATPVFGVMLAGRCVMGLGNGAFVATAYMVAGRISGPGRQASAMANVGLGFSASFVLALPAARMLRPVLTWQQAYLVLVAAALVAFFVILARLRIPPAQQASAAVAKPGGAARVFRTPALVLFMCAIVLLETGYATLSTYITPFMGNILSDDSSVSAALLAFGLMSFVGSKGTGWAADRFGSAKAAFAVGILQTCMLVLMGVATGVPALLIGAACLWQAAAWGYIPAQNSLVVSHAGADASIAISLANSAIQLGMAIGAFVAGIAIASLPILSIPFLSAGIIASAMVVEVVGVRLGRRRAS